MTDSAERRNFTVDKDVIVEALETLLCGGDNAELPADKVEAVLKNLGVLVEATAIDPQPLMEFYEELGMRVTVLLARRVSSQKIAIRTVSSARSGKS